MDFLFKLNKKGFLLLIFQKYKIKMKSFDFYAQPLQLNLNGNNKIKTGIGGYFTIITIILMFFYAWLNGEELYLRRNPKNYNQRITLENSNSITFNKGNSPFYFQILNSNITYFNDPSVLNINLRLKTFINSKIVEKTIIDINTCQKRHFPNYGNVSKMEQNSYEYLIKNSYFCPELKEDLNIYGSYMEDEWSILQILIYPCINSTNNITCKSQNEIDQTIWKSELQLSFYYPLMSLYLNNYANPISYNLKEDYYYLPKTNISKFYSYGDSFLLETDGNYFTSKYWQVYGNSINLITNEVRKINEYDPYFFSIDLFSTFYQNYYSRSYIKIFDFISSCGGFFNSIKLFFIFLNSIFFDIEVTKIMINNLFAYKNPSSPEDYEYKTYKNYMNMLNEHDQIKEIIKNFDFENPGKTNKLELNKEKKEILQELKINSEIEKIIKKYNENDKIINHKQSQNIIEDKNLNPDNTYINNDSYLNNLKDPNGTSIIDEKNRSENINELELKYVNIQNYQKEIKNNQMFPNDNKNNTRKTIKELNNNNVNKHENSFSIAIQ